MPFTQINWCIITWVLQHDIFSLSDTWAPSSFSFLRQIRVPDWYLGCKCKCSSVPLRAPWQGGLCQGRGLERHSWNWRGQRWRAPGALTGRRCEPRELKRDRSNVNLRINQLQSTCIIYLCIRQYTMKTVKNYQCINSIQLKMSYLWSRGASASVPESSLPCRKTNTPWHNNFTFWKWAGVSNIRPRA